jgi:hypothetical protein
MRFFPADFCTQNFRSGVSRYAANPLIVHLSMGHSGITRFRPCSPIATTGNHLDRGKLKIFQSLLRRLAPLTFLIRVQAFRDPLRGGLLHVQILMNVGTNPLTWDAQLFSYSLLTATEWQLSVMVPGLLPPSDNSIAVSNNHKMVIIVKQ